MTDKKLNYMIKIGNYEFYEYKPVLGRWLYRNYETLTPQRWVRFLLEFYCEDRYVVYYMTLNSRVLGYCLVAPGGRRLSCSTKEDIVLGPYYILKDKRRNGYSKILIDTVINKLCYGKYKAAYMYIAKTNIPSIKTSQGCGFIECGQLNISKCFRRLMPIEDGGYKVFKLIPNNKGEISS